jgi:hypothetical protein
MSDVFVISRSKSGLFEQAPCERKQQEQFRSTPRGLVVQVEPGARSKETRGSGNRPRPRRRPRLEGVECPVV